MGNIKECLQETLQIDGALGTALGDWKSGMCLGSMGTDSPAFPVDRLELAVAVNTEVVRAKTKAIQMMKLTDRLEDMLISVSSQYHLIRLTQSLEGLFFYLVLDRDKANLGLARLKLIQVEKKLII
jgi:hypothetical protein